MGIMETLFGSSTKAADTTNQGGTNKAGASQDATSQTAGGAAADTTSGAGDTNKSPLDVFGESFKMSTTDAAQEDTRIFGDVDAKKVMESANQVNFLQVANPQDIELVKAGGEEATKALGRILQAVTSASYGQSALASTQMIEQAAKQLEERVMKRLPSQVRNSLVDTSLASSNPAFTHPAVAPLVELAKNNFIKANPTATSEEITSMTTGYMKAVAEAFGSKPAATASTAGEESIDWMAELGL